MEYRISKNEKYGYFEVQNKPSQNKLNAYYSDKYYQANANKVNQYQEKYSDTDLEFIQNKIENKYELVRQHSKEGAIKTFIDIGCGEGFALDFFSKKGTECLGVDFSDFGIKSHNPTQIDNFRQGDVLTVVDELISEGKKFDLLWVDNVLEHVIDPEGLIQKCYQLCSKNGYIIIEVPNDFSKFQDFLLTEQLISKKHWEITPDHLNYFSAESLSNLCSEFSFAVSGQMTDFPIELFLLNEHSNYYENKSTGKQAHRSRLYFEQYIKSTNSDEQIVNLYKTLLNMGLGRQIIGLYQKTANG